MASADLQQAIASLSVQERVDLVEQLWDSVARDTEAEAPSAHEKQEIARSLAEHRADPDDVVHWKQVKASLKL